MVGLNKIGPLIFILWISTINAQMLPGTPGFILYKQIGTNCFDTTTGRLNETCIEVTLNNTKENAESCCEIYMNTSPLMTPKIDQIQDVCVKLFGFTVISSTSTVASTAESTVEATTPSDDFDPGLRLPMNFNNYSF